MKSSVKFLCALVATLTIFACYSTTTFAEISLSADSAVLYLPETNTFLYEKNADVRLPMASTTKIMTALVAIENAQMDELIVVPKEAVGTEGSSAYLKGDELLTLKEMLYALLLQSANDVSVSLACHIGGSIEGFAAMMNDRAEEMGLVNTHFTNPHGLDDKDHYTTARELAIITSEAMKNPDFRDIVSTKRKSFATEERSRTYVNHNKLLGLYDGAIGVKTGYTRKCGRCLVGAAERNGLSFITVTLNAPNDWSDHKRLLDLGYHSLEKIYFCESGDFDFTLPVLEGTKESVSITNSESKSLIVPKGEHAIEEYVKLCRYTIAPVNEGDILGEVIFALDGEEVGRVPLIARESIDKQKQNGFFKKILSIFN